MRQALPLLLIAASCTGIVKTGPATSDAGGPTSNPDAATSTDAGAQPPNDAGGNPGSDAGSSNTDAGSSADAGVTADAGAPTDGGVPLNGAPAILYTDVVSGPNTGGENNDGIYLSLFGVNFGTSVSNVSVTVGGGAVARIVYLGPSNGRPDIQQLSVQLGPNAQSGAIVVTVQGLASNADQTFTVSAGNIYFIDNLNGSDGNAGTFAAPLQTLTTATAKVAPGDFMVMKSNPSAPYTTASTYVWGVRTSGNSATSAITLMGYPGQFPYVDAGNVTKAGIYAYDGNLNNFINIVGIKLEAAGTEGAVDVESGGSNWRVVNDDLSMRSAGANGLQCNAGGIAATVRRSTGSATTSTTPTAPAWTRRTAST